MRKAFVAAAVAVAGCATTGSAMDRIMESWHGVPLAEVVQTWGIPEASIKLGDDTVYEWGDSAAYVTPGRITTTGAVMPGQVISASCVRQLTTNAAGVVTSWSYRGNNCCVMAVAGKCRSWLREAPRAR